jgi:GNAT superfamily N-acetyltransferase
METLVCDYMENLPFSDEEYFAFLSGYFIGDKYLDQCRRVEWYRSWGNYKILLAVLNGKIVGQSCAYKVKVSINGSVVDWWWGVDTFVLSKARGKGIGKKLQSKLHVDLTNFSSLSYTEGNKVIKKKLGAKPICNVHYCYYPSSSFLSVVTRSLRGKCKKPDNCKRIGWYSGINSLFVRKVEIKRIDINGSICEKIAETLITKYSLYVVKDKDFLEWKYQKNPSVKVDVLGAFKGDCLVAVIFITNPAPIKLLSSYVFGAKVLDRFIFDDTVSDNEILVSILSYYKSLGIYVEGIRTLYECSYFPMFKHPRSGHELLTMCSLKPDGKAYFGFGDQDIELSNS